jgi:hypothetical protein
LNDTELERFTEELIIAFPAFKAAAEKHSPDFERTKRAWWVAWRDLTLAEGRQAIRQALIEGGLTYESLQQPGPFIRRLVLAERGQRSEASFADEVSRFGRMERQRDYTGSPMAAALAKAIKMRQEGADNEAINAMLESTFPTPAEYDRPRYKCHACFDRGTLEVWRADTVAAIRAGRLQYEQLSRKYVYVVACNCDTGRERNQLKKPLPVYSPEKFCRFLDNAMEDELEELQKWVDKPPANYEPAFGGWSGGL